MWKTRIVGDDPVSVLGLLSERTCCKGRVLSNFLVFVWSNYSELTRPGSPKGSFLEGKCSHKKSRLVKYGDCFQNLTRSMCWFCEFCSIFVFPVWCRKNPWILPEWWEAGYESILTPTKNKDAGKPTSPPKKINKHPTNKDYSSQE